MCLLCSFYCEKFAAVFFQWSFLISHFRYFLIYPFSHFLSKIFPTLLLPWKYPFFLVCYWKGPRSFNSCGKSLSCWLVEKAILHSNLFINKSHYNISQSTFTCSKSAIETLKKWMKFTQIRQQKHQNDGIDTPFASVYIVEFEQVNVSLIVSCFY